MAAAKKSTRKTASKKRQAIEGETIKYKLLGRNNNPPDAIIELPADWKLTFASVNPQSGRGHGEGGHCIRIYEGVKLRSVLPGYTGFRDISMPFAEKQETKTSESTWESDSAGNFSGKEKVRVLNQGYEEDEDEIPF